MVALLVVQYSNPAWVLWLCPLSCYLGLAAGVMAHNHNHSPTFKSKRANVAFGMFLSLFNGYPTFAWVPTHNLNHHKFVNRAGDATITWRYTRRHNWLVASTYFFVSAYWQSEPINDYIKKARANNPKLFRTIIWQYVVWGANALGLLALALGLYGVQQGLLLWLFATLIPAFFALWAIMLFNYIQHVHTDPWSAHNHSRSFVGPVINFFLFNNGFHAAHHENPGLHWSALPRAHARIAEHVHPELQQRNFAGWLFRSYVLSLFDERFGTHQIGRAAYDVPSSKLDLTTAAVSADEAGTNAPMLRDALG